MYFHLGYCFFADLSTNTAIFDFAKTAFCTIFSEFQQLCENGSWKLLIVKQENAGIPLYVV